MNDSSASAPGTEKGEEEATVRLLRAVGPRTSVSSDRAARVKAAVRAEWHTRRRRHTVFRRVAVTALAGAAVLILFSGRAAFLDRTVLELGKPVGVVEAVAGPAVGIGRADTVHVGQWIDTGLGSRIALRFGRDTSVRLDRDSRMRALSANSIELSSGAVYVDTGENHGSLEIRTLLGVARDLGTQFEVRLDDGSMRLRVRTGVVELTDGERSISGQPGTEIRLSSAGAVTRPIAPHGPEWEWMSVVSPPIEMDGVPLATFLERLAREYGWAIDYRDALARDAQTIILRGSVRDLAPHEAVDVAITSSGLRYRLAGGSLTVFRAQSPPADERRHPQ